MSDRGEETRDCGNENRKDIRYRLDLRRIINDAFPFLFLFLKRQSSRVLLFVLMIFFRAKEASSYFNSTDCQEYKKTPPRSGGGKKRHWRGAQCLQSDFQHLILISVIPAGSEFVQKYHREPLFLCVCACVI